MAKSFSKLLKSTKSVLILLSFLLSSLTTFMADAPVFAQSSITVPTVIISPDPLSYAMLSFRHLPSNYKFQRIDLLFFLYPGHTKVEKSFDSFFISGHWRTVDGDSPIIVEASNTFGLEFPNGDVGHDAQVAVEFVTPSGQPILAKSVIFNSSTLRPVPTNEKAPASVSISFHFNRRYDITGIAAIKGSFVSKRLVSNANQPVVTVKAGTVITLFGLGDPTAGVYGVYMGTESEYDGLVGDKPVGTLSPIESPAEEDNIDAFVTHPLLPGLHRIIVMNYHDNTYVQFSVKVTRA